jgi:hypothetical protein
VIILPFPPPPLAVLYALELLQDMRRRDRGGAAQAGAVADLQRPWEPASCTGELSTAVWSWCDDVVAWINHEYAWRPAQMIPACWPRHPHIARELPVLAVQRWTAETPPDPNWWRNGTATPSRCSATAWPNGSARARAAPASTRTGPPRAVTSPFSTLLDDEGRLFDRLPGIWRPNRRGTTSPLQHGRVAVEGSSPLRST